MADLLRESFQVESELVPGGVGEFTVWIDGRKVAEKTYKGFPSESEVLEAVRAVI